MANHTLKAALFDLDGVVFNTEPQYTHFWGEQCREFHPEHPGLENEIKGQTLTEIFESHFSGELESVRPVVNKRLRQYEQQMDYNYVEGILPFLASLRERGVLTAVVTSSNRQKMAAVYAARPEFEALFDAIFTSENFPRSKPFPDCYLLAADHFGAAPDECVVFEDSFNGLKSGRAAQMRVVGLSTTNAAEAIAPLCDVVIADYNGFTADQCAALVQGE